MNEQQKAKEKAMNLLLYQDRTRSELNQKLFRAGFSEEVIEEALQYVEGFGYLNDLRYAKNYISFRKESKSKKEIAFKLREKGLDDTTVEEAFEGYEGEEEALSKAVAKWMKGENLSGISPERRGKLIAHLSRKGYSFSNIQKKIGR